VRAAVQEFVAEEAASGVVLLLALGVGLLWFNLARDSYVDVWERAASFDFGPIEVDKTVAGWVDSGLMTIFFFVVGMELKRELVTGELRDRDVAMLPIIAAIGGMVAPACIYLATSAGTGATRGWGVPVATDIALVLALLAVLRDRVSGGLKLFMLTLAVVDDLLGIAAIALFYTDDLELSWLALGAIALFGGAAAVRWRPSGWIVAVGLLVHWYCTYRSGVKAPLAGAALGMLMPAKRVRGRDLLDDLETRLHPWSAFLVVPLFGVTSASVDLSITGLADAYDDRVTWAIVAGTIAGKVIGIGGAALLAMRLTNHRLPEGVTTRELAGGAVLGAVGFSVALFIANAAFAASPEHLADARVGILTAGVLAAAAGVTILTLSPHRRARVTQDAP
jgi:NhaA family Na+:H+ antiporter